MNTEAILENSKAVQTYAKQGSIEFHDGPLKLPESMTPLESWEMLGSFIKQQEEVTEFVENFSCLPEDGAASLNRVLVDLYGWSTGIPTPGFFGSSPPQMITIKTGVSTKIQVPFGRLSLPNLDKGYVDCGFWRDKGIVCFKLSAKCKRKDERFIKELFTRVNKELTASSIYKGQCFSIEFCNDAGEQLDFPEINFIDVSKYDKNKLVLSKAIERALQLSLWTPIENFKEVTDNLGNIKRGILFAGPYGTGKTLSISATAKMAVEKGYTVVYAKRSKEIKQALEVARRYQNPMSILVAEDIDVMLTSKDGRDDTFNSVINMIDGMDTKHDQIITLLTTNNINGIEPSAIRQGRISAKIIFTQPDAYATEKLIRLNAGKLLPASEDIKDVAELLAGMNPAEIEECVTLSKYAAINSSGKCNKILLDDLIEAAHYMQEQAKLQRDIEDENKPIKTPSLDAALSELLGSNKSIKELANLENQTKALVENIHSAVT